MIILDDKISFDVIGAKKKSLKTNRRDRPELLCIRMCFKYLEIVHPCIRQPSPFTLIIGMGTIHTTLHIYRAVMLRGYIYTAPLVHLDANVNLQLLKLLLISNSTEPNQRRF